MRARLLALVVLALCIGQALSKELAPELRSMIDGFLAHRRIAIGYLRTDNRELGAVEIERLRDRWTKDWRDIPPNVVQDRALSKALAETEAMIRDSLAAVDKGDAEKARALLERAALPLKVWRQENGIRLFSDCIAEAGAVYERLDVHRVRPPNLHSSAAREAIVSAAAATEAALKRCDGEAPPDIRSNVEFRRLLDGMLNSLHQVPNAIRRNDGGTLHRLLIEQRAFDRLLAFRFG
jgi:hypothetical protein